MNTVHKFRAALQLANLLALLSGSLLFAGDGLITTIAGDGQSGSVASGIPATSAQLFLPDGIAVDASNNIFIADSGNNRVVRVDAVSGILTVVAGNGAAASGGDGGPATLASIKGPGSVALDAAGDLFISEGGGNRIRCVNAQTGVIVTIAGTGTAGFSGDGGPAASAAINGPSGLALDSAGNLYFADSGNYRVRRIDATTQTITTIAGNGTNAFTADGQLAAGNSLALPVWVAFDSSGGLLVSEFWSYRIRRVDPVSGLLSTVAGNGSTNFTGDGVPATGAGIGFPSGMAVDPNGDLFFADGTGRVRRVDAITGSITTVAGNGTGLQGEIAFAGSTGTGPSYWCMSPVYGDGGPATSAIVESPFGIQLTSGGNLLVSDTYECRVRQVDLPSPYSYTNTVLTTSATTLQPGQQVLLTATVSPIGTTGVPTGSIQFVDESAGMGPTPTVLGTAALSGGTASRVLSLNQAYSIMAVYSGDNSFNGSGSPEIAITYSSAAKLIATVTLSANQNPSPAGAPTVFTATVTPPAGTTTVPTGPVLLYDGSTLVTIVNLANGVATLSDTFTASGSHAMTATYLGDNNYSQVASAVLTETVGGSTPVSVSLTSSAPNSVYGQSVQLTISVVPALATGTIQLAVDGSVVPGSATLTNGIAVAFIPQTLGAGTHTITAAYSGDSNNQPATSAPLTQIIAQATPTLTVTSSLNPSAVGQSVTLTVTMTPASSGTALELQIGNPPANLNAVWSINSTTLTTSVTTSNFSAGTHTVTGVWAGDANVAAGTSAVLTQTVQSTAVQTTTTLTTSQNPSVLGAPVTLTATVSPATATGQVGFAGNGNYPLGVANLVNGQAQVTVTTLPAGSNTLKAGYFGDANDAVSTSAAVTQVVTQAVSPSSVTLTSSANPVYAGQALVLTAAVSPATATGTVQFLDGTTALGTVAITGGSATLSISSLSVGTHPITASYGGDANDAGSTSAALVQTVSMPPSFTLAANPGGLTITQGASGASTVTVTAAGGFTGGVSLAASGLPSGVTASFSPNPTTGSSLLSLTASSMATLGLATVTITGTSAGVPSATTNIVLFVTSQVSATNEWTWMGGSSTVPAVGGGAPGVYGTLGVPASANLPGGREWASNWTDSSGNLWLFGGEGDDANARLGYLNDLWVFNPSTNLWAWMGGGSTVPSGSVEPGNPGVYGTLGVPAAGNIPGGRVEATSWTDISGNLWMFGGSGYDANSKLAFLNDLWEFNPSTNRWAWMGGSSTISGLGNLGIYGTLGVPAASNGPGGRRGAVSWTDSSGHLWLFGGYGYASASDGYLNDLWEFNPSTNQWAWMGGSSTVPGNGSGGNPGVYGTLGVTAAGNIPGGREGSATWIDSSGHFWLFGGGGEDANDSSGNLNDLWEFNPSTNQWAWMGGSSTVPGVGSGSPGVYGTLGTPAQGNVPGGRYFANSWTDSSGNLWLFGGAGEDANDSWGSLDDLWVFSPPANQWAWMGGSRTVPMYGGDAGVYGSLGLPAARNVPGGRSAASSWIDSRGHLWLLGGAGYDANDHVGALNDLWEYQPSAPAIPMFTLSANPNSLTIAQGASGTSTVTVTGSGGFTGSVTLAATGLPSGVTASFNPNPTTGTSVVTLTASRSAVPGSYSPAITGTSGMLTATAGLALTIAPGSVSTTTALSSSLNPSTYGQSVTFTASVSPVSATGNVQFFDGAASLGAATLTGGSAALAVSTLAVGTHSITAVYGGDVNDATSTSAVLTQTVNKTASSVVVTSSANPSTFGQSGGFTATVTPITATGTVQFQDGSTVLGSVAISSGTAAISFSALSPGAHSITAVYSGDANYLPSTSAPVTQTVNKIVSSAAVTSSLNPSIYNQTIALTAQVTPTSANGTVQFLDGSTLLGAAPVSGGLAVLTLGSLSVGAHSITAVYSGDANDAPSTSPVFSQTVNMAQSSVALISSANPSTVGYNVDFTVFITPGPSTGTIQFRDGATALGTATVVSGWARLSLSTLSVGVHSITAVYSGDANDAASTSAILSQTVNKAVSSVTLASSLNPSTFGQSVTLSAAVTPSTATGTVQFLDGSAALGTVTISNGSAALSLSNLSAGAHSITAVYSGDANDNSSTSNAVAETVQKIATTTTFTGWGTRALLGTSIAFTVAVTPAAASGTVNLMKGTTILGTSTLSNGTASFNISTLPAGSTTIYAQYVGNASYLTSSSATLAIVVLLPCTTVLTTTPNPSVYGAPVTLTLTATPAAATGPVQFVNGSITLGTANLVNGQARLTVSNLPVGSNPLTADYSGDAIYIGFTSLVVTQAVNKAPTTVALASSKNPAASGQSVTFTATVSPNSATGTVQFLDGSTALGTVTISGGTAALSLSTLSVGAHSIKAVYSGDGNYLTGTSAVLTQSVTGAACHVGYKVTSQWNNGFGTAITIQNTGTTSVNGWNLTWTWAGNQKITEAWDSTYSQSGASAKLVNASYNAAIAPGATISGIGFNASYSGTNAAPAAFSLNGTLCK
jgi:N-acetylneuraminic acid mutarotase/sugar lactone lactonase YvrE